MDKTKVYIIGGGGGYWIEDWASRGYTSAKDITDAQVVVWMGGHDINPELYGEKPIQHGYDWYDFKRDAREVAAYEAAKGKFLVGVCRGGQLLNVMNGGKLYQHVNNHAGSNHKMRDIVTGRLVMTNSLHHQMMRPAQGAHIVAYSRESTYKEAEDFKWKSTEAGSIDKPYNDGNHHAVDVEVLFYPKTKSFCFQGHPEMGHEETTNYFFDLLNRFGAKRA